MTRQETNGSAGARRAAAAEGICSPSDKENFQTPPWCCDYMASLLPASAKVVLEPTPGAGNLVRAIGRSGRVPLTFPSYEEIDWSPGSFDAVLMNPPFTPMNKGYRMLYKAMEHGDDVIALLPWLALINSQRRAADFARFGIVSVTHLPRSTFPGSRVQACVLQMRRGFCGATALRLAPEPVGAAPPGGPARNRPGS